MTLCTDSELGYLRARTPFQAGEELRLDEAYRLAHLPLVAPDHPRVIASRPGTDYERGRHGRVHSLVLPVSAEALEASPAYQALDAALRAAPFADKIAWDLLPRRRDRLHATLIAALATGDAPPVLDAPCRARLAALGPLAIELRGLFSGNLNVGRLYLRVYPEMRDGVNGVHRIQDALGARRTDLYLIGLWNLVDDLDAGEAAALDAMLSRWWDRSILRLQVDRLRLLAASDDLVLDSAFGDEVRLTGGVDGA